MFAELDPAVIGALIAVVITSMLAPMMMGWVKGLAERDALQRTAERAEMAKVQARAVHDQEAADRRLEKQQDWDRQDIVAERAAEAARSLLASQVLISDQAKAAAKALAEGTAVITDQLKVLDGGQKVIHGLVNSTLTASMQADLDGKRLLLLALRRNVELEPASQETQDLILITEAKIAALLTALAEREEQQRIVDAQIQKQSNDRATV